MIRTLVCCLPIIFIASPLAAQGPTATLDFDLENTRYGFNILPLGSTINKRICVFYDHYTVGNEWNLKTRVIGAAGSVGPMNLLAQDIELNWNNKYHWDAVWHPKIKRFMVVFRKNSAIYVIPVDRNGVAMSVAKMVANYAEDPLHITWTKKGMFVIFIVHSGQLKAIAVRKNGNVFKRRKLTNANSGEVFPFDAASEEGGTAVAYYAHYNSATMELRPALLKTNMMLQKLDQFYVYSAITVTHQNLVKQIYGTYGPRSGIHTLVWRTSPEPAAYCTFDKSGSMIQAPTDSPISFAPADVLFDPKNKQFAILYYELSYYAGSDHSEFYFMVYDLDGNVVDSAKVLKITNAENDGFGAGIGKSGNIL